MLSVVTLNVVALFVQLQDPSKGKLWECCTRKSPKSAVFKQILFRELTSPISGSFLRSITGCRSPETAKETVSQIEIRIVQMLLHIYGKSNSTSQTWRLYYATFYDHNLQSFVISQSVWLWQAFPARSNVCGWGQKPTLEWSTWKVLHSGRFQPYPQTLDTKLHRITKGVVTL